MLADQGTCRTQMRSTPLLLVWKNRTSSPCTLTLTDVSHASCDATQHRYSDDPRHPAVLAFMSNIDGVRHDAIFDAAETARRSPCTDRTAARCCTRLHTAEASKLGGIIASHRRGRKVTK